MLYDVFISHANEEKDDIVRPLAEALQQKRVAVWYDEFSLSVESSLRRSIDLGLAKSRYGVVILSPHFFGKAWPEWELNGLVQRHLNGSHPVLLPIWHQVSKMTVAANSPSLADVVAIPSALGLSEVVTRILRVVQPEESALVTARNFILDRGFEPPVISDDWWLDVIEASKWQDDDRWNFPIWRMTEGSNRRGENLAWIVMQHLWQSEAEYRSITQITPPEQVIEFIMSQPGLLEISERMPSVLVKLAPQLAIAGFGGPLEPAIARVYGSSVEAYELKRSNGEKGGSGLTTSELCPSCDEDFALRHPTFGDYRPSLIACGFVQGHGYMDPSPNVKAYDAIDYLVWMLSTRSEWLPPSTHAYLLRGMKEWAVWPWWGKSHNSEYVGSNDGALCSLIHEALASSRRKITLTKEAESDLHDRIAYTREILDLPECSSELVARFMGEQVIESWFLAQKELKRRRKFK